MYLITTDQLCKKYGDKMVIDHVNMHIPEKAIYGFVGENGSGKTTIMRLLTGLAEPTSGSFTLFGVNNKDSKIYQVRQGLSAIVEATSLVPTMTAKDNLRYAAMYYGIEADDAKLTETIKRVGLEDTGKKVVKNFSLGMRQRLGIAVLLLNNPILLLLDEPMNGLDPQGIAELRELIVDLNKQGITILISSHILSELEKVATYWGFISHGKILEEISAEDLLNNCKKHIEIKYSPLGDLETVLKEIGIKDYQILTDSVRIFDEIDVTDLLVSIKKKGLKIDNVKTADVDIEEYYLNLIGKGGQD